jgi:hypothetical protein
MRIETVYTKKRTQLKIIISDATLFHLLATSKPQQKSGVSNLNYATITNVLKLISDIVASIFLLF